MGLILDIKASQHIVWPGQSAVMDAPGPAKPPEKRKVGGSTPPLTTTLTCVNVGPVIGGVQLATLVVSFLGHLPQADARTSTHSRRSQPHLLVQSAWDQRWLRLTTGEHSLTRKRLDLIYGPCCHRG